MNYNASLNKHEIFDAVILGAHILRNGKPVGLGAVQLLLKHFLATELVGPHQAFIFSDLVHVEPLLRISEVFLGATLVRVMFKGSFLPEVLHLNLPFCHG